MFNILGALSYATQALGLNQAVLSGCADIIIIKDSNGKMKSTPWHIRVGTTKCLVSKGKIVNITVNNMLTPFTMTLGPDGEAFFEEIEIIRPNKKINSEIESSTIALERTINSRQKTSIESNRRNIEMKSCDVRSSTIRNENGEIIKKQKRSLRPTDEMLQKMGFNLGLNIIEFTVANTVQGSQKITTNAFAWENNTKIIVCDIDGTITKSDIVGGIFSLIGKNWNHPGICHLLSNIAKNGYQVLYLTARAIGQAPVTKDYIYSAHEGDIELPIGPILVAPETLYPAFKREVIFKKSDLFKSGILRDIKCLFPNEINPFYGGFGNKETDAIAYRSVKIELDKIFIINTKSEIYRVSDNSTFNTYKELNKIVHIIFPVHKKSIVL